MSGNIWRSSKGGGGESLCFSDCRSTEEEEGADQDVRGLQDVESTDCPRPINCPTHRRCTGLLEREQVVQCIGSQERILSDPYE